MKLLMIAYYFPPDSSSGSFRPLAFARHLHEMGLEVCVLTAREEDFLAEQSKDYTLLQEIGDETKIFRSRVFRPKEVLLTVGKRLFSRGKQEETGGTQVSPKMKKSLPTKVSVSQRLQDFLMELLTTPDSQIGWMPSAVRAGRKIINTDKIDLIYATGGPWTCLLISAILKKFTKRPLVMDFRDPWVANPSRRSNNKFLRSLENVMERKVLAIADHIIANTAELKQDFLERYQFLTPNKVTTIPNGFEEYVESQAAGTNTQLTFIHAGTLYFSRNPRNLLQAILNVIERKVIPADDIRFVFLGGIDRSIQDPELESLMQHPLLQNVMRILPRVPYHEAIQQQNESDILLLIQPDFPLQIPRKLYEYMAFQKPIFGITDKHGATAKIIRKNDLGEVAENQVGAIEAVLESLYHQWKQGVLKPLSTQTCDQFRNSHLAHILHKVFVTCLEKQT
ncbi:hypothetical protein CSA56_13075 [candidate division KSB3 bacterium]|uniref:Glycosyltransferase subfamily 4-like N-terminal domain-containing protein n=1 Tax=candidate division KSB3 bacterium TaxID=2044937 RepID=A0A2G6KBR3_9BACT|nr:MAG: hypothetical protein CSA56_13075 [candidate division KSB3 bacterium]